MHACMCGKSWCVKRTGVDAVQMLEGEWSRSGGPGNWEEAVLVQCGLLGLWPGQVGVGVWARWNLDTRTRGTHWGMQV